MAILASFSYITPDPPSKKAAKTSLVLTAKVGYNGSKTRIHHQRGEQMITQGVLPFRYECEPTASGMTALAGLPAYLELSVVSGLTDSIRRRLRACSGQKQ